MSHWKKFESNVLQDTKRDLLERALGEMGVQLDENIKSIRNTWGNEKVDAGLRKDGRAIALGINFKMVDGKEQIELTGDFYGTGLNERGFIDRLAQVYQKHNVINKLEEAGWDLDTLQTNSNGELVLEFEQAVL